MSPQASPPDELTTDAGTAAAAVSPSSRKRPYTGPSVRTLVVTLAIIVAASLVAWWVSGSTTVLMQALTTGFLTGGIYSLIAMGLTLVYGVLHIINFANGAMVALAMYITYASVSGLGIHPYVALLITVPVMFVFGALLQTTLLNPIMRAPIHTQLLITIGVALAIENILLLIFGPNPLSVKLPGNRGIHIFGATVELSRIYAFVGALLLVAVLWVLLRKTRIGTAIRSVAANPEGARLIGINVKRIYILTFALGAAAAGAAGTFVSTFTTIEPTAGTVFNLTAFVVVVLGGMGNIPGALVGGLIVGLTEQLGGLILPGQSPLLAVFVVFLVVLFAKPQGIFGRAS
ncbi:branched-chain amino acid ABC transporter permease [uncultured Microbacterium sp.]|uniref:branched-chain amino acid ABC transporter permease n=1 Tax=uncultured Microbacterium sp. TaxID=191216 RepID=UPI0026069247|nr:branched-chain amino acid ABC transporter permease [uncultured Microbacterium sp.]